MTGTGRTFSEAWHRVAGLKVSLRHAVSMRKQIFRGETCYLLQDPFNNKFFRITPQAHTFISMLGADRTVAESWQRCLEKHSDEAPGQEDVIELLAQLYQANLLYSDIPVDSSKLFDRHRKRKQREVRSKALNLMFFRIPLYDPDKLLQRNQFLVRLLTGRLAISAWLIVTLFAAKAVADNFSQLVSESGSLLEINNLLLFYLGLVFVKILHEAGHTIVCKRLGGEVHTLGVMLIIFAPLPYMDATSSWAFRSRWKRILVGSSGMLFEFFAAACAALIWAHTGPGALHNLAYNMMVIASVSTILFNLNPLLRFDGYYILADLLEIPNLQQQSQAQLKHLVYYYCYGDRHSRSPSGNLKEAFWLTAYGLCSGVYRIFLYSAIILFVADHYLLAGLLMAALCFLTWVILPTLRFINDIVTSPQLERVRPRAIGVTATAIAMVATFFLLVPMPSSFSSPGVVEAKNLHRVVNDAPGVVVEILAANGTKVKAGSPLVRLHNPELEIDISAVRAQREEILAQQQQEFTMHGDSAREMLQKRLDALEFRLEKLLADQESLTIKAVRPGTWVAPKAYELPGVRLSRGTEIGQIISLDSFRFSAVLSQESAANLFADNKPPEMVVRLAGQGNRDLSVSGLEIIPYEHEQLPSAALSWQAGGDIPVVNEDDRGLKTIEPFFLIYATLNHHDDAVVFHGHSGRVRFSLPAEPLFSQLLRKSQQYFQKRYQI